MEKPIFEFEHVENTLILIPNLDLRELDFDALEEAAATVFAALDERENQNVVMDFYKTDYYGSTALAFFVKFWKRIKDSGGMMVFCNVSDHELEVLELTNLLSLWPICKTREEALKLIQGGS